MPKLKKARRWIRPIENSSHRLANRAAYGKLDPFLKKLGRYKFLVFDATLGIKYFPDCICIKRSFFMPGVMIPYDLDGNLFPDEEIAKTKQKLLDSLQDETNINKDVYLDVYAFMTLHKLIKSGKLDEAFDLLVDAMSICSNSSRLF